MRQAVLLAILCAGCGEAFARERPDDPEKLATRFKEKSCCGYPLGEFKLSFYWLSYEADYTAEPYDTPVFTREGHPVGFFPARFVAEMSLEGSAVLLDGRVLNYAGRCRYGTGICFVELDHDTHPVGMGVRGRPLVPYRSVAVDPAYIPIGEPLYLPEMDGVELPDGTLHDGCARADDQGGAIRKQEIDFFVLSHEEFARVGDELWWKMRVTPTLEEPRCRWLADEPPAPPASAPRPVSRR